MNVSELVGLLDQELASIFSRSLFILTTIGRNHSALAAAIRAAASSPS